MFSFSILVLLMQLAGLWLCVFAFLMEVDCVLCLTALRKQ